jgi:hypothetical protein
MFGQLYVCNFGQLAGLSQGFGWARSRLLRLARRPAAPRCCREGRTSNTDGSGSAGISPAIQLEKGVPTTAVKSGSAN